MACHHSHVKPKHEAVSQ